MKKIEMVDLKSQYAKIKKDVDTQMQEVIDSATFIKGGKVTEFQHNLESYLNVKHVIPVGNGTDALQISLMALGLKSGDEVITPTFTFIATAEVVALLGLTPVVVDVDPDTFCMTAESIERAITPRTKAIVPVHLFGQNADMESILAIAKKHNLYVVEDSCQSIGAKFTFSDGHTATSGCMGNLGCTSFFPSKNLGCYGDGGAIFTNDDSLANIARCIANHGMEVRYHHDRIGVNSRLDSLQAAVLNAKLPHLNDYIKSRQSAADYYDKHLSVSNLIKIPSRSAKSSHVFHQYTILLDESLDRDALRKKLEEKSIPSMIYYPIPLHLQKAYRDERYHEGDFPVAEKLAQHVLSLPMHTELEAEQLDYICSNILAILKDCKK